MELEIRGGFFHFSTLLLILLHLERMPNLLLHNYELKLEIVLHQTDRFFFVFWTMIMMMMFGNSSYLHLHDFAAAEKS